MGKSIFHHMVMCDYVFLRCISLQSETNSWWFFLKIYFGVQVYVNHFRNDLYESLNFQQ